MTGSGQQLGFGGDHRVFPALLAVPGMDLQDLQRAS